VLASSARWMMATWYARSGTPAGYTQVFAANLRAPPHACSLADVHAWAAVPVRPHATH
jgi:hypothetical protein